LGLCPKKRRSSGKARLRFLAALRVHAVRANSYVGDFSTVLCLIGALPQKTPLIGQSPITLPCCAAGARCARK